MACTYISVLGVSGWQPMLGIYSEKEPCSYLEVGAEIFGISRQIQNRQRRLVRAIFVVDETLVQIEGKDYWLWIAYEPALNSCLTMHLSRERTLFVCYQFFKKLRGRYGRKPIFTDGAPWYNEVCRWLRLQHRVYGTELKNLMERFIQNIKDRTECFDDNFPCKRHDCDRKHVWNWLKLFQLYINMGADRKRFTTYLVMDGG